MTQRTLVQLKEEFSYKGAGSDSDSLPAVHNDTVQTNEIQINRTTRKRSRAQEPSSPIAKRRTRRVKTMVKTEQTGDADKLSSPSGTEDDVKPPPYKYHPSELKYRHLDEIPNLLKDDMKLMFCGFNPGIRSAVTGHRYAHVTNLFWRLLIESGLFIPKLPPRDKSLAKSKRSTKSQFTSHSTTKTEAECEEVKIKTEDEVFYDFLKGDVAKEDMLYIIKNLNFANAELYLFENFDIGFTDLVSRPSKNIAELTSAEMDDNVLPLLEKILRYKPKMVCFIGKDIFKRLFSYVKRHTGTAKTYSAQDSHFDKNFQWGKQTELKYFGLVRDYFSQRQKEQPKGVKKEEDGAKKEEDGAGIKEEDDYYVPIIHVFPSTSGLVGSIPKQLKLDLFIELKKEYESM